MTTGWPLSSRATSIGYRSSIAGTGVLLKGCSGDGSGDEVGGVGCSTADGGSSVKDDWTGSDGKSVEWGCCSKGGDSSLRDSRASLGEEEEEVSTEGGWGGEGMVNSDWAMVESSMEEEEEEVEAKVGEGDICDWGPEGRVGATTSAADVFGVGAGAFALATTGMGMLLSWVEWPCWGGEGSDFLLLFRFLRGGSVKEAGGEVAEWAADVGGAIVEEEEEVEGSDVVEEEGVAEGSERTGVGGMTVDTTSVAGAAEEDRVVDESRIS
mmetsp:Transcript_13694/g.22606  ORF Transcript_13694/g.22606 Transcript_13694/m.22606 type:complete len:267 (+) Transcript_13694:384-1184(+)